MASDDFRPFRFFDSEIVEHPFADVAVTGSMESVTAHSILLIEFIRSGIHIGIVRHGLMESGVEHSDLWYFWQECLDSVDTLDVGRVVERCEVVALGKILHHLIGDEYRLAETLTSVHHSVTDSIELVEVAHDGIFASCEYLENELNSRCMLWNWFLELDFLSVKLDGYKRVGQTDFLDTARGDDAVVIHVVERVLDA